MGDKMSECDSNIKIDKDFLTAALGNEAEIVCFKVSPGSKPGDNYMSLIYSIELETKKRKEGSSIEKRNLLIKCLPSHPSRQNFNTKRNLFYRELQVYQTWLPELTRFQKEVLRPQKLIKLPFTTVVAGKAVDFSKFNSEELRDVEMIPLDNFIMMEDLRVSRGLRMPERKEPLDIHHMRLVIPALARIHALGWVYKKKVIADIGGQFPFLRMEVIEEGGDSWANLAEKNMDHEIEAIEKAFGGESEVTKGAKNFKQFMRPLLRVFRGENVEELCRKIMRVKNFTPNEELPEPWEVMIHGDCWSSNMLFEYDSESGEPVEVTLIDLQLVHEGCVTVDLLSVLYSCTTTQLRRDHLEELLKLYVEVFEEICSTCGCPSLPGFNFESFKARFHVGKVVGCLFGLMMTPLMLAEEEESVDLEGFEGKKTFGEMLEESVGGNRVMNANVTKRVLEFVEEMYEEGIL